AEYAPEIPAIDLRQGLGIVGPCALDYALQIQPLHLLAPTRLWPFCPIASGVHKAVRCSSPKITRIYKGLENLGGTPGLAPPVESIQETLMSARLLLRFLVSLLLLTPSLPQSAAKSSHVPAPAAAFDNADVLSDMK